jgi:hypothetical protein
MAKRALKNHAHAAEEREERVATIMARARRALEKNQRPRAGASLPKAKRQKLR